MYKKRGLALDNDTRYDLSPFQPDESSINEHGIIDDQGSKTYTDGVKACDIWWADPTLFTFLIKLDYKSVGFIMVQSAKHLSHVPVDYI